jgi:hypothetical protein
MSILGVALLPVRPENPNQLKFLTFALDVIMVERCIVPYPLTSREGSALHVMLAGNDGFATY